MKVRDGFAEVERLPALSALTAAARSAARSAFEGENTRFAREPMASALGIESADAATSLGNAAEVLTSGAKSDEARELLATLIALAFAGDFPSAPETEVSSARCLLWLDAHAGLPLLEPLLDWLTTKTPSSAATLRATLAELAQDRDLMPSEALLAAHVVSRAATALEGELGPTPRSKLVTAIEAFTLWLFAKHALGFVGRWALGYRESARAVISDRGFELELHTQLLGRTLRKRSVIVPLSEIALLSRETRFARAGFYAGLASLALGTYFGAGFFVDAVRGPGGSPSLLGIALLLAIAGIAADFVIASFSKASSVPRSGEPERAAKPIQGSCRLVIIPKKGPGFALLRVEPALADAMLRRALSPASPPPTGSAAV